MSADSKISVLFVCLGNICRSPMAEAVFTNIVKTRGLSDRFRIDSAGTAAYHVGDTPDERSTDTCRKHGVPVNHRARQVKASDFTDFDWILCMDRSNLSDLKRRAPKDSTAKSMLVRCNGGEAELCKESLLTHPMTVNLFGEFDPKGETIIEDPYYGGIEGFEHNVCYTIWGIDGKEDTVVKF